MKLPPSLTRLIESFERLPGIGPKTAQRLTFYLLHFPQEDIELFAEALSNLKKKTRLCSICKNVSETDICSVCGDPSRDKRMIVVVANPLDSFALERTGFKGTYHVLHGIIDPLNNIGPEEIFIKELIDRVEDLAGEVSFENVDHPEIVEIIIATNMSMEGESTAMYISKMLKERNLDGDKIKISRIARGLPVGGDVEYADDITLGRALEGRFEIK
ncbi:recombination protein RecR [candidate division WWE3 bacterium RIFOXYB1_FULL_43_24]|uniref:Recombination protein RecR n=2 Tax=Katanobacteria TaxID=422282 RepID=A0A0G0YMQ3_UNCKA|nr:MAG: Recombination protein RecR [candidate division WWE3 bacterium GW2011_GWA1_42_12]KKS34473.1 MAG: Recombination protein RecR [candidate division WWE3 bacterium GW2011_GWD1_42_14]KKS37950.1 MAG: Recombination protein RecR [candidate division WWE3 bacterium GW2011_GWF1_42_14]KKS40257.1 MAG: Recombination protein RecR [candidate division WWE3 bacterium GW2011_GWE1_42_16]KKS66252.1 MAG: Recombination protein RecR [candidate division WWE3 bacterium GW2011_GWB1_42_6]OGC59181.1 MAG: recombinati